MRSDCWQEKSFRIQPIRKNLRMFHLLRWTSLLLRVSCTCSALWNSFFKTQEWFQKVSPYCVSFQKVSLAELVLNVAPSIWQQPLPQGVPGCAGGSDPSSSAPPPLSPFTLCAPALFYTATNKYLLARKQICFTKRVTKPLSGHAHAI